MFDIDGTLVQTYESDEEIYTKSVEEVIGFKIDTNWSKYKHVTDSGILNEIIEKRGLIERSQKIQQKVKRIFIGKMLAYIEENPVDEIPGAISFLNHLEGLDNVIVSFATGGWYETAALKLNSAGFLYSPSSITSSNDHFDRTKIMAIAKAKHSDGHDKTCTYFGDAVWDKTACEKLGFNFVLVGSKTNHDQTINDFNSVTEALAYIGL